MNCSIFEAYMVGTPYFLVKSAFRSGLWKIRITNSVFGANSVTFPVPISMHAWKPSSWTPKR